MSDPSSTGLFGVIAGIGPCDGHSSGGRFFLIRQFDAFITRPMGLDRHPELRDMYFGNYEKLVYQAQTDDPALTQKARACADKLGLQFERRFTGYGDLATALKKL